MQIDRLASGLMDYFMFYTSAVTREVGTEDVTDGIVGSPAIRTQKFHVNPQRLYPENHAVRPSISSRTSFYRQPIMGR